MIHATIKGKLFVNKIARWEKDENEGIQKVDSFDIYYDGNYQVCHGGKLVYEHYDYGNCVIYAKKQLGLS